MRVLFYTAAVLATSLATVTQAIRLESADDEVDFYYDDFSQTIVSEDPNKMTDAQLDKQIEQMEKDVKNMQEQTKQDNDKSRADSEKAAKLKAAKEDAAKIRQ